MALRDNLTATWKHIGQAVLSKVSPVWVRTVVL